MNISIRTNTPVIEFNAYIGRIKVGYLISRKNKIMIISIFERYRNNGYCQNLLQYAIEWLTNSGHTPLELLVANNNFNAIHIYKKFGFVVVKEQKKSGLLEMTRKHK